MVHNYKGEFEKFPLKKPIFLINVKTAHFLITWAYRYNKWRECNFQVLSKYLKLKNFINPLVKIVPVVNQ